MSLGSGFLNIAGNIPVAPISKIREIARDTDRARKAGRTYSYRRRRILWEVPNKGYFVEMYLNPQNIDIRSQKIITQMRTKGGYMIQHWGEELDEITFQGHTGANGIEGIDALKDVYRAENKRNESIYKTIQDIFRTKDRQEFQTVEEITNAIGRVLGTENQTFGGLFKGQDLIGSGKVNLEAFLKGREYVKSLAQRAAGVVCHYQGISYKGYFRSFSVNETTQRQGIFSYTMVFRVTETIGKRSSWMPWSKVHTGAQKEETSRYFDREEIELFGRIASLSREQLIVGKALGPTSIAAAGIGLLNYNIDKLRKKT